MNKELIIFDTDIGGDCDDAGALALCHALCESGEAELLAVTCCFSTPYVAGCIDAINQHYGRIVPVGINYEKPIEHNYSASLNYNGYDEPICKKFPNRYKLNEDVPDTLHVLRKTLANAQDGSITFVVTGAFSSMAKLILSDSDEISPMTGKELVAKKIKRTVVMGGRFFETWPMDVIHGSPVVAECNIRSDISAAQTVCNEWCGELIFSSFEIGNWCISLKEFSKNAAYNPAAFAYKIHPFSENRGRESWDPTAMLYAIRPDAGYWYTHPKGKVSVDDRGVTSFTTDKNGNHTYLIPRMDYNQVRQIIDDIVASSKAY